MTTAPSDNTRVQIGLGIDQRLGLTAVQLRDLAREAQRLGYQSMWTNASLDNPAAVLALAARTAHQLTGGSFTLGVGAGSVTEKPIAAVRSYVRAVRKVAPEVPLLIGALGPQMLRLAWREADGAALNWCTPEQVEWSRGQSGAKARMVDYIRVCVDDDVAAARRALGEQILSYALLVRPSGASGYRTHFERMGFGDQVRYLERLKAEGKNEYELVGAMPERLLNTFGYAGRGDGTREWFAQMSRGLDVAVVRLLTPRPGDTRPVAAAIAAFAPAN